MRDPFEVLGVARESSPDAIKAAYQRLVREHHPDRHPDDDEHARIARHNRMAEINAAYRMLNDPAELERFERMERRRARGTRSAQPGDDGVHFTATSPAAGGRVEPAPGDPDFDYRKRAWREFDVGRGSRTSEPWTARPRKRRWGSRGA